MTKLPAAPTFEALLDADLEQVYQQGKHEVLRSRAFKILLDYANTVPKLVKLTFEDERGVARWTINELLEISNRFRLMSSPENEIRLYRECQIEVFRTSPRVREFYVLALNKCGRPAEAIREASEIIAEGGQNALIWGAMAQSYTARMLFAEHLSTALAAAAGNRAAIDPALAAQIESYFPEVAFDDLTPALLQALRLQNLLSATRIFRQGFRETGEPYPGLGWMVRTIDQLCDRVVERSQLQNGLVADLTDVDFIRARLVDTEIATLKQELDCQTHLIGIALELQGGRESRDYWTHAGLLQLAIVHNVAESDYRSVLNRIVATADADFKFTNTMGELARMRDRFAIMRAIEEDEGHDTHMLAACVQRADEAIDTLQAGRTQFAEADAATSASRDARSHNQSSDAVTAFLHNTINFCALTGNLIPLTIAGTIGRVGARVPDLLINRRVQEDLVDLVEGKILQALHAKERTDPKAVILRILQVVGTALNIGALQDLQSPAHFAFDTRSDGLIALSGVDHDMRKDTQTSTDLTAAMLMQNCDCRETMYLNGALFACWQQVYVKKSIASALLCLEVGIEQGFERIVNEKIPALLRYQLRGGQVDIYIDSIGMIGKYQHMRRSADDDTAMERVYGIAELRAGQPLTRYELDQAIIEVRYVDGTTAWLEPKDPVTGQWRQIPHTPVGDGGLPIIENAGDNYSTVESIRLLNLVESHALTFLYDTQLRKVELCDGFYSDRLFDNCPYAFGAGDFDIEPILTEPRLIQVGHRTVGAPDGSGVRRPVYVRFLHYSQADYATGLVEGDVPETIQLMGRTFNASFKRERRRLEEGVSSVPALLQKIQAWQLGRDKSVNAHRTTLDRQLTKLMLDFAKEHPELVQLRETSDGECLIREGLDNDQVYLVLSGQLRIRRNNAPVRGEDGAPIVVATGGIVGEISALRETVATASVSGDAVVLCISKYEIRKQLTSHPALQRSMEEVANYRIATLTENGYPIM